MIVHRPRPEFDPPQQPRVHERRQRAVHRPPADALAGALEVVEQLLGVEVLVLGEGVGDEIPLLGVNRCGRGRLARYSRNFSSGVCDTATAGRVTRSPPVGPPATAGG